MVPGRGSNLSQVLRTRKLLIQHSTESPQPTSSGTNWAQMTLVLRLKDEVFETFYRQTRSQAQKLAAISGVVTDWPALMEDQQNRTN
jgi:hypothetical protein